MKNGKIFKELIINEKTDFCRQYQYLQLEKPSGVEVEIPVHKTLAMDLLKGVSCRTSLGSDRVKSFMPIDFSSALENFECIESYVR